jgi:uncharacterized protein
MARWSAILVGSLSLFAVACTRTTVSMPDGGRTQQGMVVTGVGRVEARPDTLVASLGVFTTRDRPDDALEAMSKSARAMVAALKRAGVDAEDIRTAGLNVRPNFDRNRRVTGFSAGENFRVRIHDLEKAGSIVGAAVKAARQDARVSGMSLEVADPEDALQDARTKAILDARRRAEELARGARIRLGAPIAVEEVSAERPRPLSLQLSSSFGGVEGVPLPGGGVGTRPGGVSAGAATALAGIAPQIEAGVQEVVVRVSVRFAINA